MTTASEAVANNSRAMKFEYQRAARPAGDIIEPPVPSAEFG
ncbi:hypothetical protein OG203_17320 [Nocardia sp. NBC_01499]